MKSCLILAACASLTAPLGAQTSRPTTADFRWLAGNWEGHLTGRPGTTDITFTDPREGTITGIMRLAVDGKIVVVELISLVDTPDGIEMRFRHFSPALDAYETQFKQAMRLSSHLDDRDVFTNTAPYEKALMSTQPRTTQFIRRGSDEFVGRSDIIGDDGKPAIVESVYRRRK